MNAIQQMIKTQQSEMNAFWKQNSQSNPGAHFEFRQMRKELAELIKQRDILKKIELSYLNSK